MTTFEQGLKRARVRFEKVDSSMRAVEKLLQLDDRLEAYHAAFELAFQCEKLTLQARALPALSGHPFANQKMERQIHNTVPVQIGLTPEGYFGMRFPALLPKKEHGNAEFIRHSLYIALGDYFKSHARISVEPAVLVIRHIYSPDRPERRWRDHDNIEVNGAIDALALYVLRDDSAKACSHYYCSVQGPRDETQLLVIPRERFGDWCGNADSAELLLL